MSATSGKRVMPDGTLAATCMVRFRCVRCRGEEILDAYEGAPRHIHDGVKFTMEALTLVRLSPADPIPETARRRIPGT